MACNLIPSNEVLLRDQQHAARIFGDDDFRLTPKYKFLFHVAFGINPATVKSPELIERYKNEINLMVKSVRLPDIDINTQTFNQYNRKKVVQYAIKSYSPIAIKFHDDNMGLINLLWQNYYSYYYADPISAVQPGAYTRNAMLNADNIVVPYGLDNGSSSNFFNYIKIYQMARHQYVSYTLYNPIISRWQHDQLSYENKEFHDNTMTIEYEAVSYGSGMVVPGDPEGFAVDHYDQTPSPLSKGPSNDLSLSGPNNIVLTPVTNLVGQINSAQNSLATPLSGTVGVINDTLSAINAGVSGITNVVFPTMSAVETTVATVRKLF